MEEIMQALKSLIEHIPRIFVQDADLKPGERWVTLKHGTKVLLNGEGEVVAGFRGFIGKHISELGEEEHRHERMPAEPSFPFEKYLKDNDGDHYAAAISFYHDELQDKYVSAEFGELGQKDVHFTGAGIKEFKRGMKSDSVKAQVVPHLPDIIQNGKYMGKKDDLGYHPHIKAFHYFMKNVDVAGQPKEVIVDVEERKDGKFVYSLYSGKHSGEYGYPAKKERLTGKKQADDSLSTVTVVKSHGSVGKSSASDVIIPDSDYIFNIHIMENNAATDTGGELLGETIRIRDSARSIDDNGYMHIVNSHISKACVNPYLGQTLAEVPGHTIIPDKIYYGYRPGEELEKAAATFNGLPLLFEHHEDSAENPQKTFRVGSLGTDATFVAPYLDNSLIVTDAVAIEAIERGEYKDLSAAYSFVPEFTPGEYEGQPYDFIMRNIKGQHVALVQKGRAGPDVCVADSNDILSKGGKNEDMDKLKELIEKLAEIIKGIEGGEQVPEVADKDQDEGGADNTEVVEQNENAEIDTEDGGELDALIDQLEDGELKDKLQALIAQIREQNAPPATEDEDEENIENEAPEDNGQEEKPSVATDAALKKMAKSIESSLREKQVAARDCAMLIGEMVDPFAFKTPADIYKKALQLKGVDVTKYAADSYKGMVDIMRSQQAGGVIPFRAPSKTDETEKLLDERLGKIKIG